MGFVSAAEGQYNVQDKKSRLPRECLGGANLGEMWCLLTRVWRTWRGEGHVMAKIYGVAARSHFADALTLLWVWPACPGRGQ